MISRDTKFTQGPKEDAQIAERLYNVVYEKEVLATKTEKDKKIWLKTYTPQVPKQFNWWRGYIQGQMCAATISKCKSTLPVTYVIPTAGEVKKCALRNVNLEDDNDFGLFTWYATELMSKFLAKCHLSWAISLC